MRKIQAVKATDEYLLECSFDDGSKKLADIKPYLQSEAFQSLQDIELFLNGLQITDIMFHGEMKK